jgi:hypothetical protein
VLIGVDPGQGQRRATREVRHDISRARQHAKRHVCSSGVRSGMSANGLNDERHTDEDPWGGGQETSGRQMVARPNDVGRLTKLEEEEGKETLAL